jgi:hypothetical protein
MPLPSPEQCLVSTMYENQQRKDEIITYLGWKKDGATIRPVGFHIHRQRRLIRTVR